MRKVFIALCCLIQIKLPAQQVMPVTDSLPVIKDGLKAGYAITEKSEKEVGSKGNFSRYKLRFFVTNTGNEAKLFLQKNDFLNTGSAAHDIATFQCSNATGARFTNKTATLQMSPCIIEASVEDKECGTDKTIKKRKMADVGYWIKPGETISINSIMIVPLNEKPVMSVAFYSSGNGIVASLNKYDNQSSYVQSPVHIKNLAGNFYLNNQNGLLACTSIDYSWWSSQWELLPIAGSNNFLVKNRWKNNFLSVENGVTLSTNSQSAQAMWMIEESSATNIFYIKNVSDNSKLQFQNGVLKTSNSYNDSDTAAQWIIEKQ